jgi:transcriptional regulator with XRE-family HTH domain
VFQDEAAAASRILELLRTQIYTRPPEAVLLRELRSLSHLTQEEMARRLGIAQGAVSRMERRRDMSIRTLRRFVSAMGGELELVARFPDGFVQIRQFDEDDEPAATVKTAK